MTRSGWRTVVGLPAFWLGVGLRLALLPWPTSAVAANLFDPFLRASLPLGSNPWATMPTEAFPYGSVLWAILLAPRLALVAAFGDGVLSSPVVGQALIKASMMACDVVLLLLLSHLSAKREAAMVWLYWLNPVLLYVTYVHGQLDVAATLFATLGLLAVIYDKPWRAGLLWACASLCKAHVLVAMPLIVAYFFKRHFVRAARARAAAFLSACLLVTALGLLPHLRAGTAGYVMATSPQALQLFGLQLDMGQGHVLHLGAAIALLLLGRLCFAANISEAGLLMGVGVLFGTLSLVTGAMPGWYVWSMPAICLFYVHYFSAPALLWPAFCALFLAYYGAADYASYLLPSAVAKGAFTLLQTAYGALLLAVWCLACRREAPLFGLGRPLLIGIAGDSGTGKNVLSEVLLDVFGRRYAGLLEGDDYHKWERGNAKWADYTHLHPRANALDALALHTSEVLGGRHVWQPHYDHAKGTFTAPRRTGAARVAIVQGLHTLYLRDMRSLFDLKIFLAPDERVRLAWKLHRDATQRGHDKMAVLASIAARRADAHVHISPQRAQADWIIEAAPAADVSRNDIVEGLQPQLQVHHIFWNDAPLSGLVEALNARGLRALLQVERGNSDRVRLTICGELSAEAVAEVAEQVLPPLRPLTRAHERPTWRAGHHGVHQLLLLTLLSKRDQRAALSSGQREKRC